MASSSMPIESETLQNLAPTPAAANVGTEGATNENQPRKKQKKLSSNVWEYFDRVETTKVVNGKMEKDVTATCKVCSQKFDAKSKHGTSHLRNHYNAKHKVSKGQGVINTIGETFKYDEELSRKNLTLAIVMHEYPFRIVEHEYFVNFVKSLRPNFPMKSRTTCRKEILDMFKEEREKVYEFFGSLSCRLSSTMDLWTSRQNRSYMCVTVHFIDENWAIQKRIISFARLQGRHSGANLALAVMKVLFDWNIDKKMFSLTLDNDGANGVCVRDMVERLNQSGAICCGGKLFHVRCAAHIINLVVQDGINVIKKGCDSIREVVLKVKNSPILREEFEKRARECKLDIGRALSLDVSTRWNSTYMMLRDAIYYREAFERMHILNKFPNFPSSKEWQEAIELCKILKNFHKVTEILSGTSYPTSNLFFQKFCEIKLRIRDWLTHENSIIVEMASSMKLKFDKYWDQSNTVLAIASFLDPRYKMGLIDFYYPRIYENGGSCELEGFKRVLKDLYGEYLLKYQSSVQQVAHVGGDSVPGGDSGDGDDDGESEFNQFMLERSQPWSIKSDLDQYTERRATSCPPSQDFDVLGWWKTEGQEYPILSKVARDVLAVPVSTVASESAFSTGGRVINAYRSKLDSEAVEALVCIQDWVRGDKKGRAASVFDFIEETEEDGSCFEDGDSD